MCGTLLLPALNTMLLAESPVNQTPAKPLPLIGAVAGATAAVLVLALSLLTYWWCRRKRLQSVDAPRNSSSGVELLTPHAWAPAWTQDSLKECDVAIAMDETGTPHRLGEGACGQARPSTCSRLSCVKFGCQQRYILLRQTSQHCFQRGTSY